VSGGPYLQTFTNVTSWWCHRPQRISIFLHCQNLPFLRYIHCNFCL